MNEPIKKNRKGLGQSEKRVKEALLKTNPTEK
jgi:hypothetical protein